MYEKRNKILLILSTVVVAVILIIGWMIFPINIYTLRGDSMAPTYINGDKLTVNKFGELRRGTIVACDLGIPGQNGKFTTIKRIIGLPNETIVINNCKVLINGQELNLKELMPNTSSCITGNLSINIPSGQYFVVGDNPDKSLDSRIAGTISRTDIIGAIHGKLK